MLLRLAISITVFLIIKPAPAGADDNKKDCPSDPRCGPTGQAAERAFDALDFNEALRLYQKALMYVPDPRILRNIGQTLFRLGAYLEAVSYYERSQHSEPDPKLAEQLRLDLAQVQAAMEKAIRTMKQSAVPPGVELAPRHTFTPAEGRRPNWRLGLGGAMAGGGLVVLGFGIDGLAISGHCRDPGGKEGICSPYYNTGPLGGALLGVGAALSVAGVVVMTLPRRRL